MSNVKDFDAMSALVERWRTDDATRSTRMKWQIVASCPNFFQGKQVLFDHARALCHCTLCVIESVCYDCNPKRLHSFAASRVTSSTPMNPIVLPITSWQTSVLFEKTSKHSSWSNYYSLYWKDAWSIELLTTTAKPWWGIKLASRGSIAEREPGN